MVQVAEMRLVLAEMQVAEMRLVLVAEMSWYWWPR